jgi:hypothetical protein
MSIPVPIDDLRAAIAERGLNAYLLTVTNDGRPHAVHAPLQWSGDHLVVEVGRRTAANATARPTVSLLFPVRAAGDYSLIVDGVATVDGGEPTRLRVTPTKAVLHRPAPAGALVADGACGADCVPLMPTR